jgi:dipeptidyl aminopeptidase/acylaminoacyl peptidase
MRPLHAFLVFCAATVTCGAPTLPVSAAERPALKPFAAADLVRLDRPSDPQASPDGSQLVFHLRETDYDANKARHGLWLLPLGDPKAQPHRLTAAGGSDTTPRWSRDGKSVYFLSARSGLSQVWRIATSGGEPVQVTSTPFDVGSFKLSADNKRLLVSMEVFTDCDTLACTKQRLDARLTGKRSGMLYERLFVRHWDAWSTGLRSQLFAFALDAKGRASGEPAWLSRGLDGDVPSKPFGDDSEYDISPDGSRVFFNLRVAGKTEPWSTNFDIYEVPMDGSQPPRNLTAANPAWDAAPLVSPDGRTLAYRAMKRPGFEADRFGIMIRDLASGATHELLPDWDRSADALKWSDDGHTLYAIAEDLGQKKLFAIDVAGRQVRALTGAGTVSGYDLAGASLIYMSDNIASPAQLYRIPAAGGTPQALAPLNSEKLAGLAFGAYEQFSFKGWNNETVHGYVVKPVGYEAGRKYPVAFIIHGGPQGSMGNDFHYRWNPQTYAGAGFAVVMIDFHGSTGYGQAFTDAISQHWGDRPLEDLQKGWAHALAHYDFLDGKRACALGASYGGYMVNWIAGNWPEPWKCLVSHDGIFDTRMAYYDTEELWFDEWERGGTQYEHPEAYERFNPANHVAKWQVPMLVIHGSLDYRIPDSQGIAVFTALQRRGIPSQFLRFPDENHWVVKPQNSVQWHETVEAWLKKWTSGS